MLEMKSYNIVLDMQMVGRSAIPTEKKVDVAAIIIVLSSITLSGPARFRYTA